MRCLKLAFLAPLSSQQHPTWVAIFLQPCGRGGGCCINSDPSNCTRFLALLGSQISTKPLKGDYSSVFRFYVSQ